MAGDVSQALLRFGLLALLVLAVGLLGGWLFGSSAPRTAASTLVADFVVDEEPRGDDHVPATTDEPAPSSGDHQGTVRCGTVPDPVGVDDQLESLAAGVVVVQYRPDALDADALAVLNEMVASRSDRVLLAPNPELANPVEATAWTRRLPLERPNRELLSAFVTAYAGQGPHPDGCTPGS